MKKRIVYKQRIRRNITIFLIENTTQSIKERNNLLKIIGGQSKTELVCIINYGKKVKVNTIPNFSIFGNKFFLNDKEVGEEKCLFDALVELEKLVSRQCLLEDATKKIIANNIMIIGIGTCTDNSSETAKEKAIDCFFRVRKIPTVKTKYFCLTESTFLQAAEIGFESIGAIYREY